VSWFEEEGTINKGPANEGEGAESFSSLVHEDWISISGSGSQGERNGGLQTNHGLIMAHHPDDEKPYALVVHPSPGFAIIKDTVWGLVRKIIPSGPPFDETGVGDGRLRLSVGRRVSH